MLGHSLNCLLVKSTQYDGIDSAFKVVRDVAELFPRIEPLFCLIDEKCSPSKARHSRFERKSSSQRRLLEKHGHLLAGEGAAESLRTRFHNAREMQYGCNPFAAQIASRNQIISPESVRNS